MDRQISSRKYGHVLTNVNVWSPDGDWIVYDVRSHPSGADFDGNRIERVNVHTGEVQVLYTSGHGANCGVATYCPSEEKISFIHGPENPTADWSYAANHRRGVIVRTSSPGVARNIDACDIVPPFTAGALRGGSHVHVFSPGQQPWISFTYEDAVVSKFDREENGREINLRGVGVSVPIGPVVVPKTSARNHDGDYFSVMVTQLCAHPAPGSDQIRTAVEEAWIENRAKRSIAFQGEVCGKNGAFFREVFMVEIPEDVTYAAGVALQGTEFLRPRPPAGTLQRRLTFTEDQKFPGISGPRHWCRSSPDGSAIAFLMRDADGLPQVHTVELSSGAVKQVSDLRAGVSSAFTWSPRGDRFAVVSDKRVHVLDVDTGGSMALTSPSDEQFAPLPEACVFSPNGRKIAYLRFDPTGFSQIYVVSAV